MTTPLVISYPNNKRLAVIYYKNFFEKLNLNRSHIISLTDEQPTPNPES